MSKNTFFTLLFLGLLAFFIAISTDSAAPLLTIFEAFGISREKVNSGDVEGVQTTATTAPTGNFSVVKRVIDGDTIELENGDTVRYIGIDTPETKHPTKGVECYGKEASEKNALIVQGKTVRLEKDVSDKDRYGRLLRYVYLDQVMVNELLVVEGYARAASFPPDIKYQEGLKKAQAYAQKAEVGLWGISCDGQK